MDYKSEVTAFLDLLEGEPLEACEIALWHALAATALKVGRPDGLSIAMETLKLRTGFSKKSIERARNRLQDRHKLIRWRSRGSNRAPFYDLLPCVRQGDAHNDPHATPHNGAQADPHNTPHATPLYNNNSLLLPLPIRGQGDAHNDPHATPQGWMSDEEAAMLAADLEAVLTEAQAIGIPLNRRDMDRGNALVAEYGADWVLEALRRAGDAPVSARSWRYVEGILRKWREKGGIDGGKEIRSEIPGSAGGSPDATPDELMGVILP